MNPNLQYAQAIHGRFTGRGTGIIDTIHLVEVARAARSARRRAGLAGERSAGAPRLVHRLPHLADDPPVRDRRARRQEQPRHVLGHAGGGVRAPHRQRTAARVRARSFQDRARAEPDGRGRKFPARNWRAPSPTATRCSTWMRWRRSAEILSTPADNLWTFELPDGRGMPPRDGIHGSVHPEQEVLAEAARRHVRRRVADAAAEPALRRRGAATSPITSRSGQRCQPTRTWTR